MKSLALIGSLLATLAVASPAPVAEVIKGRDVKVTAEELRAFKEYIQWASASYCLAGAAPGTPIVCGGGGCPNVTAAGATIIRSFSGPETDIQAYAGIDSTNEQIVLAVRGTNSLDNWHVNFNFSKVPCNFTAGCMYHGGFAHAWSEIEDAVLETVKSALDANPDYSLVVTGHSLGAGVGTIAAAVLRRAGYACDLYTYGSPRVGNEPFAQFVSDQAGHEYRITHLDDVFCRLAPSEEFDYYHTDVEYWLSTGTATTVDYELGDIEICLGTQNFTCTGSEFFPSITPHSYYFQRVGGCEANNDRAGVGINISKEEEARILKLGQSDV